MNPSQREIDELRACYESGHQAQAVTLARALTEKYPQHPFGWRVLGVILYLAGRPGEALAPLQQTARLAPQDADAHNNLGSVLRDLGRFGDAEASYLNALRIEPTFPEAHYNLGNVRKDLGRRVEAEASYREAIRLKPDYAEAHFNLADLLTTLRRFDEAVACFEKALALNPGIDFLLGQKLHFQMMLCRWDGLDSQLNELAAALAQGRRVSTPFPLACLIDNPALQLQAAKIYVEAKFPARAPTVGFDKRPSGQKIRIGYYSADFHNHATSYLMAELIEAHDAERFEFHGFSFGAAKADEMRARVANAFDGFHDVAGKTDQEIVQMSRSLGIDIAVDLKGFTEGARTGIFAARAAPVQVSYLGYPGTMGAPYIDYIVADHTVIPADSRAYYAEKIVYLPHSYQVNDSKRRIAEQVPTRQEAGLPDQGFVFCCFNNNHKILPASFDGWMRILQAIDGAVLWLFTSNPTAMANLRQAAQARGVDAARLVFAGRMDLPDHLARHRLADLFLDTLPYNAHTTASDALWAGLPVLTCMGQSFASRVAASLLNAVGLPELITQSQAEFEARAIALAQSPAVLADIKARLERNRQASSLFDGKLFARHIEAAYAEMFRRHQAGLPPTHMAISP